MEKGNYIGSKFDLTGRVAIVTGGLGMLGNQFAETLTNAGAKVAILDMKNQTVKNLYGVDITKKKEVKLAFDCIETDLGDASILINCAGLDSNPSAPTDQNGPFEDYKEEVWDAVLDSHLKGAFLVSQELFRRFKKAGLTNGSIINISSYLGIVAPDQRIYEYRRKKGEIFFKPVAYSVAKSGMIGLTRWMAGYLAPFGIRVNAIAPGGVYNNHDPEFVQAYSQRTMLGHMANINDYNETVLLLASDASSYCTGAIWSIDGGTTAL